MDTKNDLSFYLEKIALFLLAAFFFFFPFALSNLTTDSFAIPKQALLAIASLLAISLLAIKTLVEAKLRVIRTPFDLPIVLFVLSLLLSAIFAVNKADAFTSFFIALFAVIVYFSILNTAKTKNSIVFLAASLIIGTAVSSLISILAFFRIYILPYPFAQIETFTPVGTLLDQSIYLSAVSPIAIYGILRLLSFAKLENLGKSININQRSALLATLLIVPIIVFAGLIITIYQLMYKQKPTILPFQTGFQTAFAAISQDTGRTLKGFLFGSGVGTYSIDFSRFKQIGFNQNETLWNLTFFRSSSFVLELLATTGVLGFLSFIFLSLKVVLEAINSLKNPIVISVLLTLAGAFFLPLSFVTQTLLFMLLALFTTYEATLGKKPARFFEVDIQIVALKKGLLAIESTAGRKTSFQNRLLPFSLNIIVFVFVLGIGYYTAQYTLSDVTFQKSIVAASQNKGVLTYQDQTKAINQFPYRDGFYRIYSQTNLALANSLASQIKPGETPDQQTQQNIINLIQQSINSARAATAIAPHTALNWQNLSSIYRGLIGFGQNADQFAIVTQQQAIILNPNNPVQYLTLGGIYYQLERWNEAQNQFQVAVRLKPNFANAYYNLGHALEKKGETEQALAQYEIVKTLVANDPSGLKQITEEINTLTQKGKEEVSAKQATQTAGPLEINQPSSSLPAQKPPVEIPPPTEKEQTEKEQKE